jgi:hypothetical protein
MDSPFGLERNILVDHQHLMHFPLEVGVTSNGTEIRRYEFNGSINATIEYNGVEAILSKNKGSNTWLLSGWEVKNPGESGVGNVTTRPTSSALTTTQRGDGAGLNSNIANNNEDGKLGYQAIQQITERPASKAESQPSRGNR